MFRTKYAIEPFKLGYLVSIQDPQHPGPVQVEFPHLFGALEFIASRLERFGFVGESEAESLARESRELDVMAAFDEMFPAVKEFPRPRPR